MIGSSEAITAIAQRSVRDTRRWVDSLQLHGRDADIARDVITEIRSRLAANRDSCALFDSPRFVRGLEAAYDSLWSDLIVAS